MKRTPLLLACVFALPAFAQAPQGPQGDAKAGANKIAMCIGCHGIPGYQASFPKVYKVPAISGQSAGYISSALHAYKKGDRRHPSMRAIAGSLTEQDIADVAAYYAQHGKKEGAKVPATAEAPASQDVAALLQKGACASCHGANFNTPIDANTPKIAGQYADYLYASLQAYKTGSERVVGRSNPVMAGQAKQFKDPELKAISEYIASLPGEVKTLPESRFAAADR
jgi:cytochrome c553